MNNTSKKPRKTSSSAEQLAACSLISGIAGIICSLFYLPFSLVSGKNTPMGLICGVIGIVLAIMAKNADIRPGKKYPGKALAGFIFSVIAIALTMFFFYSLINYYDLLRDPVKGPQINQLIYQMQQQLQHLSDRLDQYENIIYNASMICNYFELCLKIFLGIFGNFFYFRFVLRRVRQIKSENLPEIMYRDRLRTRGGTNGWLILAIFAAEYVLTALLLTVLFLILFLS